jgi:hypothetical protein
MDHETFAQLLGNYGEFVGSLGVVATLFYLAIQVRQTRLVTAADLKQRLSDALIQINRDHYTNPEFAELLAKLPGFASLSELDTATRIRVQAYAFTIINRARQVFELHEQGFVDRQTFETSGIGRLRSLIIQNNVVREHWENVKTIFSTEFQQCVDADIKIE